MRYRLDILKKNGLGLNEIQEVIATLEPLPGARDFIDWLRSASGSDSVGYFL